MNSEIIEFFHRFSGFKKGYQSRIHQELAR